MNGTINIKIGIQESFTELKTAKLPIAHHANKSTTPTKFYHL